MCGPPTVRPVRWDLASLRVDSSRLSLVGLLVAAPCGAGASEKAEPLLLTPYTVPPYPAAEFGQPKTPVLEQWTAVFPMVPWVSALCLVGCHARLLMRPSCFVQAALGWTGSLSHQV